MRKTKPELETALNLVKNLKSTVVALKMLLNCLASTEVVVIRRRFESRSGGRSAQVPVVSG